MSCKPDLHKTEAWYEEYQNGWSLEQIAKMHLVSRQTVYMRFKRRGLAMRSKTYLPFVEFNGERFTRRSNGYFARTNDDRSYLHRIVWEHHNGAIPLGFDIHHINGNIEDNRISNLECISKADHARKYPGRKNQHNKERKCG